MLLAGSLVLCLLHDAIYCYMFSITLLQLVSWSNVTYMYMYHVWGVPRPKVQPLTPSYTIFDRKGTHFINLLANGTFFTCLL